LHLSVALKQLLVQNTFCCDSSTVALKLRTFCTPART